MALNKTFSIFCVFLFLFLASCGKSNKGSSSKGSLIQESSELQPEPEQIEGPSKPNALPNEAYTFDFKVKMIGFTRTQEEKVLAALELIKKVVATEEFKKRIYNKKFNGKKIFVDNAGLSNSKIYKRILEGAEMMGNNKKNNTMDLELELYHEANTTIGYTYPDVKRIWMNKKYFNNFRPHQVADNLFHEWLHKIGFKHAVEKSPSRAHSVPYAVGYIVKALTERLSLAKD